ncbi:nucleotidyltransferase family protein [Roseibium sp. CAU 1637]|uniref:Nucleotidyltransferase family protein n=1 Tax=Roseibium limicola TaxID=2816037 RepID=A0A939J9Q3_9HYPH|nr:nucleotidyltransferase family protein [Roseibium limicola]MBO0345623.1 nucleotidyltransferase family protein [Roseibium limicola]
MTIDLTSDTAYRARLRATLVATPDLMRLMTTLRSLELPDAWIVSGCIYQTVWNQLTGRDSLHGLKDYDAIYFDPSDISFEAEDREIQRLAAALPDLADKLELRNQARVHLWYPEKFGQPYPQLTHATQSLNNYAAETHAVAARLTSDDTLDIVAPFGLSHIFELRLVPNYVLDNSATYASKGERMKQLWPELTVVPWDKAA